jgi:esterase/lipase
MKSDIRIESLLSARLLLSPQLVEDRIYFISDLSGRLSLYSMRKGGSLPKPLLPPDIALQNPKLAGGESFIVFPEIDKILVMIDRDGDENYLPHLIPVHGGNPQPVFEAQFEGYRVFCIDRDIEKNIAYLIAESRTAPEYETYRADIEKLELHFLGKSPYGNWVTGWNDDHSRVLLIEAYTSGDHTLYLWDAHSHDKKILYGKPVETRSGGEVVPLNSIGECHFVSKGKAILFFTSIFSDNYSIGYLELADPNAPKPVEIRGTVHEGKGVFEGFTHLEGNRFVLHYNIDGCSFMYEAELEESELRMNIIRTLCGTGRLTNGVVQHFSYEKKRGNCVLSFSTASSPSQLFTIEGNGRTVVQHSDESILGISGDYMASGTDASCVSHDGLRISARLYYPSKQLGFTPKFPVIFYIHGGPQSQERPDFTWFSMPLIQYFTLNGFAVFVPNVRGSTGFGLDFMKRVDHDWGGQDRLDHVHAFESLKSNEQLDMSKVGVMGRSYGGYMTLTLAGRHPELWKAACDMFGPYNLLTFVERIPEAWKTYFHLSIGHPVRDREFLEERSPSTYLHQLSCPMLVIQGKNDPRVKEVESRDLVTHLQTKGKEIEYLLFDNEGHDVLKFENRVKCYTEIVRFFIKHLKPDRSAQQ